MEKQKKENQVVCMNALFTFLVRKGKKKIQGCISPRKPSVHLGISETTLLSPKVCRYCSFPDTF
jgi:hypothetical protein